MAQVPNVDAWPTRQSREDHYWRIWTLGLLAAAVASWYLLSRRNTPAAPAVPAALA